jgi:hypothetical protein
MKVEEKENFEDDDKHVANSVDPKTKAAEDEKDAPNNKSDISDKKVDQYDPKASESQKEVNEAALREETNAQPKLENK